MDNIRTEHLELTPVVACDCYDFIRTLFSDDEVKKFYVLTSEHAANTDLFVDYIKQNFGRNMFDFILHLKSGEPVGLIGSELFHSTLFGNDEVCWNVSYAIMPKQRNMGYATEALLEYMKFLKQYSIPKAYLDISENNVASQKVAERVGFKLNPKSHHIDPKHLELGILWHWEYTMFSKRDVFFCEAISHYQMHDYRGAVVLFQQAIEQPYNEGALNTDALCYSNMGIAYSSCHEYVKAYECLNKALSLGLNNASIQRELSNLKAIGIGD